MADLEKNPLVEAAVKHDWATMYQGMLEDMLSTFPEASDYTKANLSKQIEAIQEKVASFQKPKKANALQKAKAKAEAEKAARCAD